MPAVDLFARPNRVVAAAPAPSTTGAATTTTGAATGATTTGASSKPAKPLPSDDIFGDLLAPKKGGGASLFD